MIIVVLALAVICCVACVAMAKSRGRNQMLWGILGFLFGVIPIIILAVIGPAKS